MASAVADTGLPPPPRGADEVHAARHEHFAASAPADEDVQFVYGAADKQGMGDRSPRSDLAQEGLVHGGHAPEMRVWTPAQQGRVSMSTAATLPSENGLMGGYGLRTPGAVPALRVPAPLLPGGLPSPPSPVASRLSQLPVVGGVVSGGVSVAEEEVVRAARESDLRSAYAGLPKIRPHWQDYYVKILLVGEDGLGRTTLCRNLFAAYMPDPPVKDASIAGAKKVFREEPRQLLTHIKLPDEAHKICYHYLVQDTPGYGDSDDLAADRRAILASAIDCWFAGHGGSPAGRTGRRRPPPPRRRGPPRDYIEDCSSAYLRQMDLQFIRELSALVPVVPILAKADTMTAEELRDFRHRVRAALPRAGAAGAGWHFSREALEEAGARHGPPFAVVASNSMDLATGRFWPVRRYPWGSCEALLSTHSDLSALRRLLFETAYNEIKDHTEHRYHAFRRRVGGMPRLRPKPAGRGERAGEAGGPIKAAASQLLRSLATVGGLVAAVWLVVNGLPMLRDEVYRKETVRRVKNKGEASTAAATKDTTKRAAREVGKKVNEAAQALETEETRRRREEEERRRSRKGWFGWLRG
eukprot:scaffold5.g696.t1